ncbi:MAG TPA: BamA/TamA family outer membrane protein [bacterium]|nr:BamA/TamA family outer membrane protein [bacterium]
MRTAELIVGVIWLLTCGIARAGDADSSGGVQKPPRDALDYILAVPSVALKAPFWVLGAAVSGPVVLVEESTLPHRIERLFAFDDPWGIYPVVGYKARTGLTLGAAYFTRSAFGSDIPLSLRGTYSTNTYRFAAARLGDRRLHGSAYGAAVDGGWRADTRERFYGIGPGSSRKDQSNYGYRGGFAALHLYRALGERGEVSLSGGWRRIDPEDGRLQRIPHDRDSIAARFAGQDLYGLFERLDLYDLGAQVAGDWRERPPSPLGGGAAAVAVTYTMGEGRADTAVGFWRVHGDVSHFFELFHERVIGVRLTAEHIEPDPGTRVPFYELAKLGGSQLLRGYKTGRFRDRGYAALSLEYRWPLWRRIDALLLSDHGRVFHDLLRDFEFSDFRSSYGGGLRFWNNAGHLALLVAKGTDEWGFYINFGDSF